MPQSDPGRAPVGIFDSGVGGLTVAAAVAQRLPAERLLYVADNAYAPYGPRPAAEIRARSLAATDYLLERGAKLIVVACNTATSLAIDELRERYPAVPFVGLEPAVKPTARAARVGVLATAATLASRRYHDLRARYLAGKTVYEDDCAALVPLIENGRPGDPALTAELRRILRPMLDGGLDALVLGCTHYPLATAEIAELCGPAVDIIDPSPAAARQVERVLTTRALLSPDPPGTCVRAHVFVTTGSALPLQRTLLRLPPLNRRRKWVMPRVAIG